MENPFVGLTHKTEDGTTGDQVRMLSEQDRRQKRDALYAKYTSMVNHVLDQLITAYRPGIRIKGSDSDHTYCCHCRWYAGPEETGQAHYGDHAIRRRIEIELETDYQFDPTGFKILFYDNHAKCLHVGLSQDELVRGIKLVFA